MLYPVVNKSRSVLSLDGIWDFKFSEDENWKQIYVPSSFNSQFTDSRARSYSGLVIYRRLFIIPNLFANCRRLLRFGAVTHDAVVNIDGKEVVSHRGGFLPFEVDITELCSCGEEHQIQVLVDNRINYSSFPVGNESATAFFGSDNPGIPSVENGKKKIAGNNFPNFDFFNYAGITRSVCIYTTPMNHIEDISYSTLIEGNDGIVKYSIDTNCNINPLVEISDKNGKVVFSSIGKTGTAKIKDANFWFPKPGIPYLYNMTVSVGEDIYCLHFGIRTVKVDGTKFLINGNPFYFKGVGKHEDSPIRGRGVDNCLNIKDIELLKWLGANSFRTSHYPYDEGIYDICDKEGIVIIDELPAVGLNFAGIRNPYQPSNCEYHLSLLRDLISRDKNHPCVVMWSLGNEPDTEHFPEDALDYWHYLYLKAHALDPESRPVTVVCCQNDYTKDLTTRSMDVVCINRYYGWYNLSGYLDVAKEALAEELDFWEKTGKPLILSEYGADAISGMHMVIPEMFSEEFQVEYLEAMNCILDKYDFVIGEHPWNFADFDTVQGPMRAGGNHKGLFTRDRNPKMAAHMIKKRWTTMK